MDNNSSKIRAIYYSLTRLEKVILDSLDFKEVVQNVCDSMLYELDYLKMGYRIVVLSLINDDKKKLRRISISQTIEARKAVSGLPLPFETVEIPMTSSDNICIKTMLTGKPLITHEWSDILSPPLSKDEANALQHKVGIKTSMVYPLMIRGTPIGMMIFSMIKSENDISEEEKELILRFVDIVALAVQNAKLYTTLEKTSIQLKRANARLTELDKLKDEFVYVASHELRTPMTAIKSYLWLALHKDQEKLGDELKRDLGRAYISTERLIKLVQDMLIISRIEGKRLLLNKEKFDLYELIKQIYEELKIKATEKKIDFVLVPNKEPMIVFADKIRISEVVQNLIGNALKFTPEGGDIILSVYLKNGIIETSISDTGPGITKENLPFLFQKFGRLEQSYSKVAENGGTGLGLYISKQIIEMLGGKIWVESEEGKGSTFSFTVPLAKTT